MVKGQKVFLKTGRNISRRDGASRIIETTITAVGRKYYTVEYGKVKFYINTLKQKTDYSADYSLYESKQDILDEEEMNTLKQKLRKCFDIWGQKDFTLDQLRKVAEILEL